MCQRIYNFHLEASRNWMYLKTRLHTLLRFDRWTLSSTSLSVEGGRPQDPWDLVYLKLKPFTRNKNSECNMTLWRPGLPLNSPPYSSGGILCSLFFLSFLHLAFIWPRYWLRLRPGTGLLFSFLNLAFVWPRYWPLIGPGAGLLTSFLNLAFIWPRYWSSFFFLEFCFYPAQEWPRYWPSFFFLEFSFYLAPVLATDWPRYWLLFLPPLDQKAELQKVLNFPHRIVLKHITPCKVRESPIHYLKTQLYQPYLWHFATLSEGLEGGPHHRYPDHWV